MSPDSSPAEFARALQERRRRTTRRRLILGAAVAGVVVVVGAVLAIAWFSPWFVVNEQRVEGTSLLAHEDIVAAAGVPSGTPLVAVDASGAASRVAELAPVAQVEVGRRLPDILEFRVTERSRAFVRASGASYEWVDPTGHVFHTSTDVPEGTLVAETPTDAEQRLLADVATVIAELPDGVSSRVTGVEARAVDQISLALDGGATVVWGSAEQSGFKAEVLEALLATEAEVYDVSAPGYPTTR